jgi:alkanesulfonate monooxygenase SsuD/methylene tetrahydromethanopterin reductase-like flavin-dependent oxidoreductase (luciferase family)
MQPLLEAIMKFGLDIPIAGEYADPRKLADLAFEAEESGWDGFFIWDIIFTSGEALAPVVNPWVALAAIAMRTQRIRIGAMLTPLSRRRPWQVARETVALDILSHGRLTFGAGSGYQERDFTPFGEEYDPKIRAEKLDEGLEVLKGLWSGENFSFHGKHYQLENVTFLPKPLQSPGIPVWLAGGWPNRKPLRRAARWDGIYLMTVNQVTNELLKLEEIREAVTYMKGYREGTGPFDVAVNGEVPDDAGKAAEIIQAYQEAGATWWIALEGSGESFEEYRARIRQGPPRYDPSLQM